MPELASVGAFYSLKADYKVPSALKTHLALSEHQRER